MSLETVSAKRNRVYARRFDHDEARLRHAAGDSIAQLAREYGVSQLAVLRVVNDRVRARMEARIRAYQTSVCEECRGVARPSANRPHPDGRVLCRTCRDKARRTRFEYTPGGIAVAAWCFECKRMLDLDEFPGGVHFTDIRPNGIHASCRECNTRRRREYRNARRIPCSHGCGAMVLHERRDPGKPPECSSCANRRTQLARTARASQTKSERAIQKAAA